MSDNENGLYDREEWQGINRVYAAAGVHVVMPEEQEAINAMAAEMDNAMRAELPYDGDPVARRIAGHMVEEHVKAWDVGRRNVYEGFCSESEATLFVLSKNSNAWVTALRNIEQLQEVQHDRRYSWRCDTIVTAKCGGRTKSDPNAEYPVEFLAIKRGEHICVFTASVSSQLARRDGHQPLSARHRTRCGHLGPADGHRLSPTLRAGRPEPGS